MLQGILTMNDALNHGRQNSRKIETKSQDNCNTPKEKKNNNNRTIEHFYKTKKTRREGQCCRHLQPTDTTRRESEKKQ